MIYVSIPSLWPLLHTKLYLMFTLGSVNPHQVGAVGLRDSKLKTLMIDCNEFEHSN